jgi:type I restriction enzyme S subunit
MKAGWQHKTISEVCDVVNGGTPKTGVAEYWDGPHQWITPAEMGKRDTPYIDQTERTITDAGLQNSSARLLPKQSVILSSRAPIGHLVINTATMATNQGCKGLVPRNGLDSKYLYYYLTGIVPLLNDLGSGATFKELSGGKLKEVPVPVAPLPEQHRIVAILDEAFDSIATAKANAEKNLENARALFESHLQAVFTQRGEGWVEKPLAKTCEVFADGDWIESKDQSSDGIRLIQTGNVGIGVFKDRGEKARHISEATFNRLRCTEIFENDCLISRLPDPVGRSCLLPDTGERMITAVDCTIVRFKSNSVNPAYFSYYSQSSTYLNAVESETTGTTRKRISRSKLGLVQIPIAPLAEQQRIVARLNNLSAETQRLASLYQRKLAALDALKKSLLHQAFSGTL